MSGRLLTAAQVAERLGVTVRYVWRLGRDGALPRVKLSHRCVRFEEADVEAFITAGRTAPTRRAPVMVAGSPDSFGNPRTAGRRRRRFGVDDDRRAA